MSNKKQGLYSTPPSRHRVSGPQDKLLGSPPTTLPPQRLPEGLFRVDAFKAPKSLVIALMERERFLALGSDDLAEVELLFGIIGDRRPFSFLLENVFRDDIPCILNDIDFFPLLWPLSQGNIRVFQRLYSIGLRGPIRQTQEVYPEGIASTLRARGLGPNDIHDFVSLMSRLPALWPCFSSTSPMYISLREVINDSFCSIPILRDNTSLRLIAASAYAIWAETFVRGLPNRPRLHNPALNPNSYTTFTVAGETVNSMEFQQIVYADIGCAHEFWEREAKSILSFSRVLSSGFSSYSIGTGSVEGRAEHLWRALAERERLKAAAEMFDKALQEEDDPC